MESPFFTRREIRWTTFLWPLLTLALGWSLTWYLVDRQMDRNAQVIQQRLTDALQRYVNELEDQLSHYRVGLRGARGFIEAQDSSWVGQQAFRRYVLSQDLAVTLDGSHGFGFIRRVPPTEVGDFVRLAQVDGNPAFKVHERAPNPGERRVVQLFEPREFHPEEIGLDVATVPERRQALQLSLESGQEVITPPLALLHPDGRTIRSFGVFLPVFAPNALRGNRSEREDATIGWVYAMLMLDDVLRSIPLPEGVWLRVDDRSPSGLSTVFFSSQTRAKGIAWQSHRVSREVQVYSRTWTLTVDAGPQFIAAQDLREPAWVALQAGLSALILALMHLGAILLLRRQQERLASQALLATITRTTTQAVVGEDDQGKVIIWNEAAERLFGAPASRAIGRTFDDVLADHHMVLQEPEGDRLVRSKSLADPAVEAQLLMQGVIAHHLAIARSPIVNQRGASVGRAMLFLDITQRKQLAEQVEAANRDLEAKVAERTWQLTEAHDALSDQQRRMSNIIQGTRTGTWEWQVATGELIVNDRWLELMGYTRQDMASVDIHFWWDHVHPDDAQRVDDLLQSHFAGVHPFYETELRLRHRDGHWVWVRDAGQVHTWGSDGKPEWMFGSSVDISAQKQAQIELENTSRFLARTGRAAGVAGWAILFKENRFVWTKEMSELTEVPEGFVVDNDVSRHFLSVEDHRRYQEAVERLIAQGQGSFELEFQMITAKGRPLWVRVVAEIFRDGDYQRGSPAGVIGAVQDITERHRYEEQLQQAKEEAERANEGKSQFLANMSHEIRTPLNALLGITDLMLASELTAEQRQLMAKSKTAGRSLMAIVNNVLDLAKIESGQTHLVVGVVDVQSLLEEIRTLYAPQAQAKGLALVADKTAEVPRYIKGDRDRLREVLVNLVGNAIKFTHAGKVELQARLVTGPEGTDRLQWHVTDTGIGLTPEQMSRLFQPFVQADASTTRRYGGTGLGLAIVKRLSELMGGGPGVASTPGQGSDFWVDLPLQLPEPEDIERLEAGRHALRVLVVSRTPELRQRCGEILQQFGWHTEACDQGSTALRRLDDLVREGIGVPDVLVVDQVSDMAREALLPALRHLLQGTQTVILLTSEGAANPQPSDLLNEGAFRLPLDPSEVFNAVTDVLARSGHAKRTELEDSLQFGAGLRWLDGVRILLVEDNEINMEIARRLLAEQGAQVHGCVHGREAVDWLQDPAHEVDLVLMDVQMPVMDGLEATQLIRTNARWQKLPILALTAGALEVERRRALDAGMFDFLTKPLEAEQLIRAIRHWVAEYRGELPAVRSQTEVPAAAAKDWPELPGIDVVAAKARMASDLALLHRMLHVMLADQPPHEQWRDPGTTDERQRLAARLHKLKGSSGMLGAVSLFEAARRAEQSVRAGAADIEEALEATWNLLELLRASARQLDQMFSAEDAAGGEEAEVSAADRQRLVDLLQAQDFSALALYADLRKGLRRAMSGQAFEQLDVAMQSLRFREAQELLKPGA